MNISTILQQHQYIVLYDGECGLCSKWIRFICNRDTKYLINFSSVHSNTGQALLRWGGLSTSDFNTLVYIEKQKIHIQSDAILKIMSKLGYPWRLLTVTRCIPARLRNILYDWVARNRFRLSRKSACTIQPTQTKHQFLE